MLGERLREHGAKVWLVNTGWSGGGYGVGSRMNLGHTRAMVHAAVAGQLSETEFVRDPVFGLDVPMAVPGVPPEVLQPRGAWEDTASYDTAALRLADMFKENFQQFENQVTEEVRVSGPR